jgi:hypothetical protein
MTHTDNHTCTNVNTPMEVAQMATEKAKAKKEKELLDMAYTTHEVDFNIDGSETTQFGEALLAIREEAKKEFPNNCVGMVVVFSPEGAGVTLTQVNEKILHKLGMTNTSIYGETLGEQECEEV